MQTTFLHKKTRKAIFIIADGIPADVIERVHTPALDVISRQGGYVRAYVGGEKDGYSQTPTISAVGYNSLLTGTWVNKHNVWDNDIAKPNYFYWNIFRFFKARYPKKKTAVFSTWILKLTGKKAEKNCRKYTSATQHKHNSSNAAWPIKELIAPWFYDTN